VVVVVTPPHTNRSQWVGFPPVVIRKYRMLDGSCREAILDVLAGADAAAGEPMTFADVRAFLQANDAVHSADTVYKALRRMADDGILTWAEGIFRLTSPEEMPSTRPMPGTHSDRMRQQRQTMAEMLEQLRSQPPAPA
jgi:hypothetical protein